jgi:hypothetical protein
MPTKKEREYYSIGYRDAVRMLNGDQPRDPVRGGFDFGLIEGTPKRKPKRKLSAWNKFVKANSRKKEFRYRDGKLNLKKMGVAFRRKKRR